MPTKSTKVKGRIVKGSIQQTPVKGKGLLSKVVGIGKGIVKGVVKVQTAPLKFLAKGAGSLIGKFKQGYQQGSEPLPQDPGMVDAGQASFFSKSLLGIPIWLVLIIIAILLVVLFVFVF